MEARHHAHREADDGREDVQQEERDRGHVVVPRVLRIRDIGQGLAARVQGGKRDWRHALRTSLERTMREASRASHSKLYIG